MSILTIVIVLGWGELSASDVVPSGGAGFILADMTAHLANDEVSAHGGDAQV